MTEPYHQKTIELDSKISGNMIIGAMKEMAADSSCSTNNPTYHAPLVYSEEILPGESQPRIAGFSGHDSKQHVVILTGERLDKAELDPTTLYSQIAVGTYYDWGGLIWAQRITQQDVEKAVNDIAADLESRLSTQN